MGKIIWKDIDKKNVFTVRSAAMIDLANNKPVRSYVANTKIQVVQKAIHNGRTFYRTQTAKTNGLDWAFRASAFGLPDEIAPSAPSPKSDSLGHSTISQKPKKLTPASAQKQTSSQNVVLPEDGEGRRRLGLLSRLFRRKNG